MGNSLSIIKNSKQSKGDSDLNDDVIQIKVITPNGIALKNVESVRNSEVSRSSLHANNVESSSRKSASTRSVNPRDSTFNNSKNPSPLNRSPNRQERFLNNDFTFTSRTSLTKRFETSPMRSHNSSSKSVEINLAIPPNDDPLQTGDTHSTGGSRKNRDNASPSSRRSSLNFLKGRESFRAPTPTSRHSLTSLDHPSHHHHHPQHLQHDIDSIQSSRNNSMNSIQSYHGSELRPMSHNDNSSSHASGSNGNSSKEYSDNDGIGTNHENTDDDLIRTALNQSNKKYEIKKKYIYSPMKRLDKYSDSASNTSTHGGNEDINTTTNNTNISNTRSFPSSTRSSFSHITNHSNNSTPTSSPLRRFSETIAARLQTIRNSSPLFKRQLLDLDDNVSFNESIDRRRHSTQSSIQKKSDLRESIDTFYHSNQDSTHSRGTTGNSFMRGITETIRTLTPSKRRTSNTMDGDELSGRLSVTEGIQELNHFRDNNRRISNASPTRFPTPLKANRGSISGTNSPYRRHDSPSVNSTTSLQTAKDSIYKDSHSVANSIHSSKSYNTDITDTSQVAPPLSSTIASKHVVPNTSSLFHVNVPVDDNVTDHIDDITISTTVLKVTAQSITTSSSSSSILIDSINNQEEKGSNNMDQNNGKVDKKSTQWIKIYCPGQKIKIRPRPNIEAEIIGMFKHDDEIEVERKLVKGFYHVVGKDEYINKNTQNVVWIELDQPTPTTEQPLILKWYKVQCPGLRLKIRPKPDIYAIPIGNLKTGDVIEVYPELVDGFYELSNNKGYVNKYTHEVEWLELTEPPESSSSILPLPSTTLPRSIIKVQIKCIPTYQVKIRKGPHLSEKQIGVLKNEDIIEVFEKSIHGYYQLIQQSGYINKHTKGIEFIEVKHHIKPKTSTNNTSEIQDSSIAALEESDEIMNETVHFKIKCAQPNFRIKIRGKDSLSSPIIGMLQNGDEIEVYRVTSNGYYRLKNREGYIHESIHGIKLDEIDPPARPRATSSLSSMIIEQPIIMKWIQLICRNEAQEVIIRQECDINSIIIGYLTHEDIIHVYDDYDSNFYQLIDREGYVNKRTQMVEWHEFDYDPSLHDMVTSSSTVHSVKDIHTYLSTKSVLSRQNSIKRISGGGFSIDSAKSSELEDILSIHVRRKSIQISQFNRILMSTTNGYTSDNDPKNDARKSNKSNFSDDSFRNSYKHHSSKYSYSNPSQKLDRVKDEDNDSDNDDDDEDDDDMGDFASPVDTNNMDDLLLMTLQRTLSHRSQRSVQFKSSSSKDTYVDDNNDDKIEECDIKDGGSILDTIQTIIPLSARLHDLEDSSHLNYNSYLQQQQQQQPLSSSGHSSSSSYLRQSKRSTVRYSVRFPPRPQDINATTDGSSSNVHTTSRSTMNDEKTDQDGTASHETVSTGIAYINDESSVGELKEMTQSHTNTTTTTTNATSTVSHIPTFSTLADTAMSMSATTAITEDNRYTESPGSRSCHDTEGRDTYSDTSFCHSETTNGSYPMIMTKFGSDTQLTTRKRGYTLKNTQSVMTLRRLESNMSYYGCRMASKAIVIDVGSYQTKVGFADDTIPKAVFHSAVACQQDGEKTRYYVGKEAIKQSNCHYPYQKGIINTWDEMEALWEHCFYDLKVDPGGADVFLTEAHLPPRQSRETIIETMFELFDVGATYLHVQPVLALFAQGKTTGCVVDSGEYTTSIYPVADGYQLQNTSVKLPYGGAQMTEILSGLMSEKGYNKHFQSTKSLKTLDQINEYRLRYIRDLKEKYCFIDCQPKTIQKSAVTALIAKFNRHHETPVIKHRLPDNTEVTLCEELYMCTESLFESRLYDQMLHKESDETLQSTVHKVIMKCPVDCRKSLYNNIVLSGGNTMFPGFEKRFTTELKQVVPPTIASSVRVHGLPDRNHTVWIGGSILAGMSTFEERWITGPDYDEYGPSIVHEKCPVYL